jgi:hypothetical protein
VAPTVEVSDKQYNKLVEIVKKNPGNSERWYSEQSGIPMNAIGKTLFEAEVEADPSLAINATPAGVTAAVKKGNLRWPRIAAYAGVSVGAAKKLYEQHTGEKAPSNITARGRQFNGTGGGKPASGKKDGVQVTQRGTSGRRQAAAQPAASGRGRGRQAAQTAAPAGRGRRGTRAGAADPK